LVIYFYKLKNLLQLIILFDINSQKGSLKWAETSKTLHEMVQTRHFRSSK